MNHTDSDYAAFLDRLPELRRLYDRRLHQFEVTRGPGHGDSLRNVEHYFRRVGSIRDPNRQTLRRLIAFVDHVLGGMSREDAVEQAWRYFPDPRYGAPRSHGTPPAAGRQPAALRSSRGELRGVHQSADGGLVPSLDECVERIDVAYRELGHSLGWRFLMGPRRTLSARTRVALVTSNPGGKKDYPEYPRASVEQGNAYWVELWLGRVQAGDAPLQRQVQRLFDMVVEVIEAGASAQSYVEHHVLCAYFVPFRSPRFAKLLAKRKSINFGRALWSDILTAWTPTTILTIDPDAFGNLYNILSSAGSLQQHREFPTGWGDIRAEAVRIQRSGCGMTVTLARLPHLSTFKLFSRANCRLPMDSFIRYVFEPPCPPLA